MPGTDEEKFAGVRAFYTYMLTHPGKKLLMMGSEFGQWNEWHYEHSLDWHLLELVGEDGDRHRALKAFFQRSTPSTWPIRSCGSWTSPGRALSGSRPTTTKPIPLRSSARTRRAAPW